MATELEPFTGTDGDKEEICASQKVTQRDRWSRNIDFFFSLAGYTVGLGNVWRFPYLCYKNGGGAFLVPYFLSAAFIAFPIFFLEIALGQYTSLGGVSAWNVCPLFKGIGFGAIVAMSVCNIYYNVIIAWAFYYLFASFTTRLPWSHCNNTWNTENCITSLRDIYSANNITNVITEPIRFHALDQNTTAVSSLTSETSIHLNASGLAKANFTRINVWEYTDPVTEFWTQKVLQVSSGIDDVGTVRWDLALCLILAWIVVYVCIWKGIKSSGKVMYFTVTAPYLFMVILLIRGVTLSGALEGIKFYIIPDWKELTKFEVWVEAGLQVVYTYSIGAGILPTLGSYNKFHHNCYRDSLFFVVLNSCTSILAGFVIFSVLGFMAYQLGVQVAQVAQSGPGLAFIAYPQAVAQMPLAPLWSALFFVMIILLGLDSEFVGVEGVVMAVIDEMPHVYRHKKGKEISIAVTCCVYCILGITMVTNGGIYVMQLLDYYNVRTLCVSLFLSCIVISYIYGVNKFYDNIKAMLGYSISPFMKICWMAVTPCLVVMLFIMTLYSYDHLTYNRTYHYPTWCIVLGWMISCGPIISIPTLMIIQLVKAEGSLVDRFRILLWPASVHKMENTKPDLAIVDKDDKCAV